jgi:hypothetical protein
MDSPVQRPDYYLGLKSLSDQAFPKRCLRCGRHFATAEDFIRSTQTVRTGDSGLKSVRDESDRPMVELFRNCPCGSTLMDRFDDRRDLNEPGLRRRKLFGRLLQLLVTKGMSAELARVELLKLLRGEPSATLADLGVEPRDLQP